MQADAATLCLGILITWSPEDVDEGIQAILLQIYPILLSTLLSVGRKQLSLFDAHFALTLTSSPLTVYLVVASTCDWFGIETGLYKRIKSRHLLTRTLGTLVLILWFGLSVTVRISDRAFVDSGLCKGSTFGDWLLDFLEFLFFTIEFPGVLVAFSHVAIYFLVLPAGLLLVCMFLGWVDSRDRDRGEGLPHQSRRSVRGTMWCVLNDWL